MHFIHCYQFSFSSYFALLLPTRFKISRFFYNAKIGKLDTILAAYSCTFSNWSVSEVVNLSLTIEAFIWKWNPWLNDKSKPVYIRGNEFMMNSIARVSYFHSLYFLSNQAKKSLFTLNIHYEFLRCNFVKVYVLVFTRNSLHKKIRSWIFTKWIAISDFLLFQKKIDTMFKNFVSTILSIFSQSIVKKKKKKRKEKSKMLVAFYN